MFFYLSKTIGFLLNPLVILLLLLLPGIFIKKRKLKNTFLGLFAFFFIVFSNPLITNEIMLWWEVPPVAYMQLAGHYDAAVVLSGVTASDKGPYDRVHLYKGADRIMHAVQLYKLGKVNHIILSGGSGAIKADTVSEAERMRRVMVLSGVPTAAILVEGHSRNTHENAAFSKPLLKKNFDGGKFILVTSAFHMKRAQACFAKEGIQAKAFSTDFYTSDDPYKLEHYLIPQAESISTWEKLLREWVGLLTYKLMGYI